MVIGDGMISLQSDSGLVIVCESGNNHLPALSNFLFMQVKELTVTCRIFMHLNYVHL